MKEASVNKGGKRRKRPRTVLGRTDCRKTGPWGVCVQGQRKRGGSKCDHGDRQMGQWAKAVTDSLGS